MSRAASSCLLAAPGVLLALVGLTHPSLLTAATAHHWWVMHLVLIPVWPLLGLALWWLVRGRGWVTWVAGALTGVYAAGYSALDILAGVGAGYATAQVPGPRTASVVAIFSIGNALGDVGAVAFLVLVVVVAGTVVATAEPAQRLPAVVAAVVLLVAAVSFLDSHIYPWRGVVTVLAIGVATGVLGWVTLGRHDRAVAAGRPVRPNDTTQIRTPGTAPGKRRR